jgi:hypothetical protein
VQWGWDVAWRRFVCVVIGITAAWLFSYSELDFTPYILIVRVVTDFHAVPPVSSGKRAIRQSYARTISISGTILCEILSHANDPHHQIMENMGTRTKLLDWRSKLNKVSKSRCKCSISDAVIAGSTACHCEVRVFFAWALARRALPGPYELCRMLNS